MRVMTTRRGARLIEAGTVLSDVLREPGPTHSLFDVLAACVASLPPGPRVALLGFAAGGMVAPLRAMGFAHPLEAVDLSRRWERLFRRLSGPWAGRVSFSQTEASLWLRRTRTRYDVIVEDLFARGPSGMAKPEVALSAVPLLMQRRLGLRGVAVINTLPVPGRSWREILAPLAEPFPEAHVVVLQDFENRILILGRTLGTAREVSRKLRSALRSIGSRQASRMRVSRFRDGGRGQIS